MATYTEANAITYIWRALRDVGDEDDEQLLTNTEILEFLRAAERRYNIDRPRMMTKDVTADGTAYSALPTGWEAGYSQIYRIESPIGDSPPTYVDERRYGIYQMPDQSEKILWLTSPPGATEDFRVVFSVGSVVATSALNTTVPDRDFYALADLTVSYCADAVAGKFAQAQDPIISSDVVSYRSKTQDWRDIAKRYELRYRDALGLGTGEGGASAERPASRFVNWDLRPATGHDYLFHQHLTR